MYLLGLRRTLARAALAWGFVACSAGSVQDSTGPAPGTPVDTTGTVQRGSLEVSVTVDAEDAALVQPAGVSLEGLTVRIQRRFSTQLQPRAGVWCGHQRLHRVLQRWRHDGLHGPAPHVHEPDQPAPVEPRIGLR
jgi:hypothetical protein